MASFIKGEDRRQLVLFNECIEDRIASDNEVRVIDLFVESLNLEELGFKKSKPNARGTNHYDDNDMLKLYLYGYRHKVRSSRRLAELCRTNIEVMWLVRGITPDFRTISDFRKENPKELKRVFRELVITCNKLNLITNEFSQDGVKIQAVNSKEKNYTLNKLDDRIKKIEKFLKEMDEVDKEESKIERSEKLISKEELEEIIKLKKEKKEEYEAIRKELEESGESQKSLTDPDAKLMKNNGKFTVGYNDQVLVDANSHLVVNYQVSNNPADVGSMRELVEEAKELLGFSDVVKNITDKGYNDREDMANCLENGIIPEVTLPKDKEYYEIEVEYEEKEITEEMKKSSEAEDIKNCLKAGIIPEVYEEFISDIEVVEKIEYKTEEVEENIQEMSEEEIRDFALKNKCFARDMKTNKVYCPEGETLRKKSNSGGREKYCNKLACKNCKNPCTMAKFKEVVFSDGQIIVTSDRELKKSFPQVAKTKKRKKVKKVKFKLKPKEEDIKRRMGVSEHTHGTMKRSDDAYYFLTKGLEKVDAELAIYYSGSNLRRMINIVGVKELIAYFTEKIEDKMRSWNLQSA